MGRRHECLKKGRAIERLPGRRSQGRQRTADGGSRGGRKQFANLGAKCAPARPLTKRQQPLAMDLGYEAMRSKQGKGPLEPGLGRGAPRPAQGSGGLASGCAPGMSGAPRWASTLFTTGAASGRQLLPPFFTGGRAGRLGGFHGVTGVGKWTMGWVGRAAVGLATAGAGAGASAGHSHQAAPTAAAALKSRAAGQVRRGLTSSPDHSG